MEHLHTKPPQAPFLGLVSCCAREYNHIVLINTHLNSYLNKDSEEKGG